jgi:UDP-N-acetylmuramoyl-tripeptide--D-alanyl-D-alanine ligase
MKKFPIKNLAEIIKAEPTDSTGVFTGVSIDSRTTNAGDCFFAIDGDNFDGHDYVANAFVKGAVCAVVSKDTPGDCILKVSDCTKALGDFAGWYRRQGNFKVVAITGSVGKTTTRQIAHHILSQRYRCRQAPKNFNNNIGLSLTLLAATDEDKIVIAELGSNYPGEIAYLTRIAAPDIAVITNIHPVHLAGLVDSQTIIKEKLSIAEALQPEGTFLINGDCDNLVDACRAKGISFTTFGKSVRCDIQAKNITYNCLDSRFTIDGTDLHLPLPGPGNLENALAAWAICYQFGISIDDFTRGLKTLSAVPMRAELLQIGTLTVLNDCYNANPASMKNALDILANLKTEKRRLAFICGDMAELGKQAEVLHAELGIAVAQAKVQLLLTIGKLTKITAETAKAAAKHDLEIKSFEDNLSACNNLEKFIKDYDIVLVKGSRVAKLEMAVEKLKELFSK